MECGECLGAMPLRNPNRRQEQGANKAGMRRGGGGWIGNGKRASGSRARGRRFKPEHGVIDIRVPSPSHSSMALSSLPLLVHYACVSHHQLQGEQRSSLASTGTDHYSTYLASPSGSRVMIASRRRQASAPSPSLQAGCVRSLIAFVSLLLLFSLQTLSPYHICVLLCWYGRASHFHVARRAADQGPCQVRPTDSFPI